MKIHLVSPQPISPYLGISRVLIELSRALDSLGATTTLVGPKELGIEEDNFSTREYRELFSNKLKLHILENAANIDVIDYDHEFLPFSREDFPGDILMVTRTVLLTQWLRKISPPKPLSLRSILGRLKNLPHLKARLANSDHTLQNADLINVPNKKDKEYLIELGYSSEKICVIPYAQSTQRIAQFDNCRPVSPDSYKIVFIGTFDYRKGAMDFNKIFRNVLNDHPKATLHLLGSKGLFQDEKTILNFFDQEIREKIFITMSYERESIGELLRDMEIGIFPSYMEGFPFGIIEMLSAYIPVMAYDAPGAGMSLPHQWLVSPGRTQELASIVNQYLHNGDKDSQRIKAREIAMQFTWEKIAQLTLDEYKKRLK